MTQQDLAWTGAGVALAGLAYAAGACPTICVGDSGEVVAAVQTLGIPHPSGYPLYVLLGKAWTVLLPIGTVAWQMRLFSTACAALAVGLTFGAARELGLDRWAAALAALPLAFSPCLWSQATAQRVYALNAVMAAVLAGLGAHHLLRDRRRGVQIATLLLPAALLATGWHDYDRSRYRIAEDFSRQLLAGLPPGAQLAASDDNVLFVLIYLQLVEGLRPDVDLILQGLRQRATYRGLHGRRAACS